MTNWNKITKPSGTAYTKIVDPTLVETIKSGSPIGLLLSLTYANQIVGTWNKITKASGTSWTKITKAV